MLFGNVFVCHVIELPQLFVADLQLRIQLIVAIAGKQARTPQNGGRIACGERSRDKKSPALRQTHERDTPHQFCHTTSTVYQV